jgi:hypothetical protein
MIPLYAARVSDLKPGDFVGVECVCGHDEMIPAVALAQGLRLWPDERIVNLPPRLRCRKCDVKGRAVVVSEEWPFETLKRTIALPPVLP